MIEQERRLATDAVTRDSLFDGRLSCLQHRQGYRFSVDAVLVAHFLPPARGAAILDLGAGCGIIGLIMMYRWGERIKELTALEIQSRLADLARRNFEANAFQDKCRVVEGDLRQITAILAPESCSQVVCNPPFYRHGSGRRSVNQETLAARHQILCGLDQIIGAAAFALKTGGSLVLIYPAEGLAELTVALATSKLEIKRLQCVYSYPDPEAPARLVLIQAVKRAGKGGRILAPWYIYTQKHGGYSEEMRQLYQDRDNDPGLNPRPATGKK
ncbi:methyltransferase [Desulfoprunum benzoelyticum]|uniref:tRNA1Val (Adenine37-N6)-methyltransferase n=1 Tax=Desulfoprunum benzoelyticum TaxID=1506996 RepID=A0A840UYG1_9BACT|nr:methyltransferase [Desulfoprunum benzoelyticum]MBB5346489.1 tRNA1Val (adenine37-N6)-methyltransferase [Desulfoprunum benzoelyticum]MBM9528982.1 methyltransferase [Desulfoprunum benzoelyticum]